MVLVKTMVLSNFQRGLNFVFIFLFFIFFNFFNFFNFYKKITKKFSRKQSLSLKIIYNKD